MSEHALTYKGGNVTAVAATVTGDNNCIIAEQDKNARAEIVCLLYIYIRDTLQSYGDEFSV